MSQRRIMQCLNGCWQISFLHPHPLQYGNSRSMSSCVSVFRLPAWAGCSQRVAIPSAQKVLLAPQHCLRGGFTGGQRSRDGCWWACTRWLWSAACACQSLSRSFRVLLSWSWERVPCSGVDGDTGYIHVTLLVRKAGSDVCGPLWQNRSNLTEDHLSIHTTLSAVSVFDIW